LSTHWHLWKARAGFETREADLCARESLRGFLDKGAIYHRHDANLSLPTLLSRLHAQNPIPLCIQDEVEREVPFAETRIGAALLHRLAQRHETISTEIGKVKSALLNAEGLTAVEIEAFVEDFATLKEESKWIEKTLV
jgi:hypothetical protein